MVAAAASAATVILSRGDGEGPQGAMPMAFEVLRCAQDDKPPRGFVAFFTFLAFTLLRSALALFLITLRADFAAFLPRFSPTGSSADAATTSTTAAATLSTNACLSASAMVRHWPTRLCTA